MARARRLFSSTARECGGGELIVAWHVESRVGGFNKTNDAGILLLIVCCGVDLQHSA